MQQKMEDQEIKKAIKAVIKDLEKLYDVTADKYIEYSDFHAFSHDTLYDLFSLLKDLEYRTDFRYAFKKFNKEYIACKLCSELKEL